MRSASIGKLIKVIASLVRSTEREIIADGFLKAMDSVTIDNYYCKYSTKLNGRKWLAPLYRPILSPFRVRAKMFVAVRANGKAFDLEYVDESGESVTYTVTGQEWREKEGYFIKLPPERFRGDLGHVVDLLTKMRKGQAYAGSKD
jgi:hypothetical protein